MIKRVWRGWAEPDRADDYQQVLLTQVIPSIAAKSIPGLDSMVVLREDIGDEVEFSTIMTFGDLRDVMALQGEDYARCYVPDAARAVLKRWDETCRHYEVVAKRTF